MTEKSHHEQARDIERREEGGKKGDREDRAVLFVSERKDRVLGKKAAERWAANQGQRADREGEERDRQMTREPAHLPDVLLVMQHDDDSTCTEEEQRLEEGMREKVKHAGVL